MGDIVIELNRLRAPATSNNFLRYVTEGQYNGTIFHRVIPEFVIQSGGYTESLEDRDLHPPVLNESGNGLKNMPMTVAMARFDDPHSATSQFFINLSVNSSLLKWCLVRMWRRPSRKLRQAITRVLMPLMFH